MDKIKEEFFLKIAEFSDGNSHIEPYSMQKIADWWLSKMVEREKEWKENIENTMKILAKDQIEAAGGLLPYNFFYEITREEERVLVYRRALEDFYDHFFRKKNDWPLSQPIETK